MALNRRVKIRPPKRNLNDGVDIEKSWNVLSFAISEIYNKNASNLSFEQLYRKCYHLVLRKQGEQLYNNVKAQLRNHLLDKRSGLVEMIKSTLGSSTLQASVPFKADILVQVNKDWEDHCLCMRMISDVLMYMDRVYVKESQLPMIYDVGITLFRDYVIQYNNNEIGTILNHILMSGISSNRSGRLVDKFLIKSIIKMYESLVGDNDIGVNKNSDYEENYYLKSFEPFFMERSFAYYSELSNDLTKLENGLNYITRVNEIIIEEENMSVIYLPKVTFPKLIQLLDGILLTNNIAKVVDFKDQGFNFWVLNDEYKQLNLLYSLVSRIDKSYGFIQANLKKIVLEEGSSLEAITKESVRNNVNDTKKKRGPKENLTQYAIGWIENVCKLKEKFDIILEKGFKNNTDIQSSIESSFVEFLNQCPKTGEYLSLFIDSNIKKSSNNKTEEECEKVLDKCVIVFRYLKDKDLFEKYFKNHLTRRLLQQKSMSIDLERSMISKLRQEVGSLYTSKLEGMFRDMKVSKDLSLEFGNDKKTNFEANILTTTFWPLQINKDDDQVIYPDALVELKEGFEKFYLGKHRGRNLTWAPNFGSVDIRTRYKKRAYEINMPTYAGIIMLLFEYHGSLTFEEISEMTNIPKQDLTRHLQSISVAPKTRLLKKIPMTKEINPADKFIINENFESSTSKFKVLTVSLSNKVENDNERTETMASINNSRKFEVDAAIVRIMKSRKTLSHNELIAELIKQLNNRFNPPPSFIKQRIESLLEREYLERNSENRSVYTYLA
ncbi:cullin [Saccharomycopsis crataegensis]|uniref:Cullin n=1 Tax=Saccharomycopsis crataegensis TaxID=43959 RepID=A0AAV5QLE2_9ASCO|nr:cullin [Saccharomycopsis crataegensis]